MSERKPKRILKKVSVSLSVVVILLLAGELAVRLFTNIEPPVITRDPTIGRRFITSFEGPVYDEEAERDVHLRFNSIGFRGPEWDEEPAPDVRRVAILGDSMMAAVAVEEELTLAHLLQDHLNASHPSVEWQVMNFGVSGSSTGQELVQYRNLVRDYAPDLVLVGFFTGNDLVDNHAKLTSNPRIYFDLDTQGELEQLPFSVSRAALSRWMNLNSRLYVWNKSRPRVSFGGEPVLSFFTGYWILSEVYPDEVGRAWEITEKVLEELERETEKDGTELGLFLVPCAQQVYTDAFENTTALAAEYQTRFNWDYPDQRLAEVCERNGTWFATLTEDLRAAAPSASCAVEEEWVFLKGVGHFNTKGHALGARSLHGSLTAPRGDAPSIVDAIVAEG